MLVLCMWIGERGWHIGWALIAAATAGMFNGLVALAADRPRIGRITRCDMCLVAWFGAISVLMCSVVAFVAWNLGNGANC